MQSVSVFRQLCCWNFPRFILPELLQEYQLLESDLPGKVISVVNMKGGVGKTTTVVSLAETLAAETGKSVVVIDVDTQANSSYCIAGDDTLKRLIHEDRVIDEFFYSRLVATLPSSLENIVQDGYSRVSHRGQKLNVSLVASSPKLRLTEREIIHSLTGRRFSMSAIEGRSIDVLAPELEKLKKKYEYIIFDCAPGISAFTVAAVALSDLVIMPTIPDFISNLGLTAFLKNVLTDIRIRNEHAKLFVLVTRKNGTRQHSDYHERLREEAGKPDAQFALFETAIPESVNFPRALGQIDNSEITYAQKYKDIPSGILPGLAAEVKEALS